MRKTQKAIKFYTIKYLIKMKCYILRSNVKDQNRETETKV